MVVSDYKGFDDYFIPVNEADDTWRSVLCSIHSVLDDRYLDNRDGLEGIKLNIEFRMEDPANIDYYED